MELGLACLLLLCALRARAQGDFDLADALDDHQPTKKPGSNLYPNLPSYPDPGNPDIGGNNYPRPKPRPRPPSGNSDYMGGHNGMDDAPYPPRQPSGGGGSGGFGSHGDVHGRGRSRPRSPNGKTYGGDDTSTYGSPQGNTVARIVSPIVSVVVVALVGAGVSYCKSSRRGNCMRGGHPETV